MEMDTVRKHRKHKHRSKQKFHRISLLGLRTELLDLLNCILYIMWSPIVFFARLLLILASLPVSAFYKVLKLFTMHNRNSIRYEDELRSTEKKPKKPEKQRPTLSSKLLTKQSSDFGPRSCSISQEVKKIGTIVQMEIEDRERQKESQPLRKKFKLPLKMVDEMHESLKSEGDSYFQYSLHYQDISSVELSSDCLSDKHSSRFLKYKGCKKRTVRRQYQDLSSTAGKKLSFSMLRNHSSKDSRMTIRSKRLRTGSRDLPRKSELGLFMKNFHTRIFDTTEASEKSLQNNDAENQYHAMHKYVDLKPQSVDHYSGCIGATDGFNRYNKGFYLLPTDFKRKRCTPSRPIIQDFSCLSLKPILLEKSSPKNEEKQTMKNGDHSISTDLESNLVTPQLQNNNSETIVKPNYQLLMKLKSCLDIEKVVMQNQELNNTPKVSTCLSQCNGQKLVSEHDAKPSSIQCDLDWGVLENKTTVSRSFKNVSDVNEAVQREGCKKETVTRESPKMEDAEKDLSQSGSGDRWRVTKHEIMTAPEFTKPIDAKSKWIEMKKKFYGKSYVAMTEEQPEKLTEQRNISQILSVSKPPAHEVFQYNMQVGRARQMKSEVFSAEDIFVEKKTPSCLRALENSTLGLNPRRNEMQFLKSVIPAPRRLSQTQSLSQWPLDSDHSFRGKKVSLLGQTPKPKPRTKRGDSVNRNRIARNDKTKMTSRSAAQFAQRSSTCADSSVSSIDFRNDQVLQNSQMKHTAVTPLMQNVNVSDEYVKRIDSFISFSHHPYSAPRESINRNST